MTQSCNADHFAYAKLPMEADRCGTLTSEKITMVDSAAIGPPPKFCTAKLICIALLSGVSITEAMKRIYGSATYKELEKEESKLWRLGPVTLYEMLLENAKS